MKKIIVSLLCAVSCSHAMNDQYVIKPFDEKTDQTFVFNLLDQEQDKIMIAGSSTDNAKEAIRNPSRFTTHVLFENKRPIGFVTFSIHQCPLLSCCGFGLSRGKIDLLAIDPEHRKKGHGRCLIRHAIEELNHEEPIKEIGLYVNRDNAQAIELYKKLSFEKHQLIPSIYFDYYALRSQHSHQN